MPGPIPRMFCPADRPHRRGSDPRPRSRGPQCLTPVQRGIPAVGPLVVIGVSSSVTTPRQPARTRGGCVRVVSTHSGQVVVEVSARVPPVERASSGVVAVLERQDPGGKDIEVRRSRPGRWPCVAGRRRRSPPDSTTTRTPEGASMSLSAKLTAFAQPNGSRCGTSRCRRPRTPAWPEAYGSVVITFSTSSANQAIPVFGAMVPSTCPPCASYAAKYANVPPRPHGLHQSARARDRWTTIARIELRFRAPYAYVEAVLTDGQTLTPVPAQVRRLRHHVGLRDLPCQPRRLPEFLPGHRPQCRHRRGRPRHRLRLYLAALTAWT